MYTSDRVYINEEGSRLIMTLAYTV